jgi:negative regulator of sigma E activity
VKRLEKLAKIFFFKKFLIFLPLKKWEVVVIKTILTERSHLTRRSHLTKRRRNILLKRNAINTAVPALPVVIVVSVAVVVIVLVAPVARNVTSSAVPVLPVVIVVSVAVVAIVPVAPVVVNATTKRNTTRNRAESITKSPRNTTKNFSHMHSLYLIMHVSTSHESNNDSSSSLLLPPSENVSSMRSRDLHGAVSEKLL